MSSSPADVPDPRRFPPRGRLGSWVFGSPARSGGAPWLCGFRLATRVPVSKGFALVSWPIVRRLEQLEHSVPTSTCVVKEAGSRLAGRPPWHKGRAPLARRRSPDESMSEILEHL